jgi:hypothetical protein
MKSIYSIIIIIVFSSNAYAKQKYFGAPNQITDWIISCTVDKGSIVDNYPNYIFKTSKNKCSGDKTYKQRAEIVSKKALPLSSKVAYDFQSDFTFEGDTDQKFDIFQMHDGRDSCAPPLKVEVQKGGEIRLIGDYRLKYDYKEGDKEQCERDIIKSKVINDIKIKKNGKKNKLNVILILNGNSNFDVGVFINNKFVISGRYSPPKGKEYYKSKYFYFKHGNYSRYNFDYTIKSKIKMIKLNKNDSRIKSIVKSFETGNSVSLDDIKKALIEKEELSSCIMKAGLKEGIPEKKLMKSLRKAKEGKRKHLTKISTFVMNGNCSIN